MSGKSLSFVRSQAAAALVTAGVVAALVAAAVWQYTAVGGLLWHGPTSTGSAFVRADPNPLPRTDQPGTTTIAWSTGDGTVGQVWVSDGGQPETLFAQGADGATDVPWIAWSRSFDFRLYAGTERAHQLASTLVFQELGRTREAAWRGIIATLCVVVTLAAALGVLARYVGRRSGEIAQEPAQPPVRVARLDALTSLRFPAAALVLFFHLRAIPQAPAQWGAPFPYDVGVAFFFVISGFVLTYAYPTLLSTAVPRFWWARFARIWPIHAATFLLMALLFPPAIANPAALPWAPFANLGLVQAWIPHIHGLASFNAPAWSVSVELAFYLSFPFLLAVAARSLAGLLVGSVLLLAGMLICATLLFQHPLAAPSTFTPNALTYTNPLTRQFEFVLGIGACYLWRWIRSSHRLTPGRCAVLEFAALFATVGVAYGFGATSASLRDWLGDPMTNWLRQCSPAVPFSILVVALALNRGALSRFLSFGPFVLLGEISYSVYMVHYLLIRGFLLMEWAPDVPLWIAATCLTLATLALAYVSWRFLELPCRRYLVSLAGGSATLPSTPLPGSAAPVAHIPLPQPLPRARERLGEGDS